MDVSRETKEQLTIFTNELRRWGERINLVSRVDLENLEARHIDDSIQIASCGNATDPWVDIGSGGGLPGLVAAIVHKRPMTLVEADARKCAFLRQTSRKLGLSVEVLEARIEALPPQNAKIISARALASFTDLLTLAAPHLAPDGLMIFPKGETWRSELDTARKSWHFEIEAIPSQTRDGAAILLVRNPQARSDD